jgi:hypothetical protein
VGPPTGSWWSPGPRGSLPASWRRASASSSGRCCARRWGRRRPPDRTAVAGPAYAPSLIQDCRLDAGELRAPAPQGRARCPRRSRRAAPDRGRLRGPRWRRTRCATSASCGPRSGPASLQRGSRSALRELTGPGLRRRLPDARLRPLARSRAGGRVHRDRGRRHRGGHDRCADPSGAVMVVACRSACW